MDGSGVPITKLFSLGTSKKVAMQDSSSNALSSERVDGCCGWRYRSILVVNSVTKLNIKKIPTKSNQKI